jgi:hypothetical protein
MNESDDIRGVSATENSFRIIESLQKMDGARIGELTEQVDISK